MIQVTIRLFAGHRDIVGHTSLTWDVEAGTTVQMVWERLAKEYPRLQGYSQSLLYAVNGEFAEVSTELHHGDEVAYIPPVSGGSDSPTIETPPAEQGNVPLFLLTTAPIDPAPLVRLVQTPGDGAVVTFAGVVRNNFDGRATAYLTYEAYQEMALSVLATLANEVHTRWTVGRVAVHHRLGRVDIGENAVLVVVAAPHRQAAFDAAAYIMDRIKEVVPIWKQEHWADGASEWHHGNGEAAKGEA